MRVYLIFFVLLVTGGICLAQDDSVMIMCSGRGFKEPSGNCVCALGWFGKECELNPSITEPGLWWTFRVLMMIFYGFFMILSFVASVLSRTKKSKNVDSRSFSFFNVKRFALGSVVLLSLDSFLYYALDPEGFDGAGIPPWIGSLLFILTWPMVGTMFLIVLFHWVEIYHRTVKVLRQEEMLSKINKNYSSNVTLEDILSKVKFVSRFKIPFLISNGIAYLLSILTTIFLGIPSAHPAGFIFLTSWQVYCSVMFFTESIGFLIYGRRMTNLMPQPLDRKMRKVTTTISIMAGLFFFGWIFSVSSYYILAGTAAGYLVASFVSRVITLIIIVTMLSIFFKIKRTNMLCCITLKTSATHSQNSNTNTGGSSSYKRSADPSDMELATEGN